MSVRFKEIEESGGNRYEVYTASGFKEALEYLRRTEVKRERQYIIVETPDGSFGKDMIMIFNETTNSFIEYGARNPLPEMKISLKECTLCGYPVFPFSRQAGDWHLVFSLEDLKQKGYGFLCRSCQTIWCALCVHFNRDFIEAPDNVPACKICGRTTDLFQER